MYVKVVDGSVGQYPYTLKDLKAEYPLTSFQKEVSEEILNQYSVYSVQYNDAVSYDDKTENLTRDSEPSLVDGVWTLGWTVTDKTPEEITTHREEAAGAAREERNRLLTETDWTQGSDSPLTDAQKTEWLNYRSLLRSLPEHSNWPYLEDVDWPTKPE